MPRIIEAFAQFLDDEGNPIVEGFLQFLQSGSTSTDKDTYEDVGETTPNTNPVALDAAGRCPSVFGQGSYRVVLYDNDMVMIDMFDPVNGVYGIGQLESWNSDTTYGLYALVADDSGHYYSSLIAGNQGNDPSTDTTNWEQIEFVKFWNANATYSQYDRVRVETGGTYVSNVDSNIGNAPAASPTEWEPTTFEVTETGEVGKVVRVNSSGEIVGQLPVTNFNSGTAASAATYWRGDGAWGTPSGSGNVTGPGSATDNAIARYDSTTGEVIQNSVVTIDDAGVLSGTTNLNNVDNTSDATKNAATATLTNKTIVNPLGLDANDVGLGNVDNLASDDASVGSTLVQRTAGADVVGRYFNMSEAAVTGSPSAVFVETGSDGNTRKQALAQFKTNLTLTKSDVGLGNVDNTSDATKNAATATLTNKTLTTPVINNPTGLDNNDVGLGNVENKSSATIRGEIEDGDGEFDTDYTRATGTDVDIDTNNTEDLVSINLGTVNANSILIVKGYFTISATIEGYSQGAFSFSGTATYEKTGGVDADVNPGNTGSVSFSSIRNPDAIVKVLTTGTMTITMRGSYIGVGATETATNISMTTAFLVKK